MPGDNSQMELLRADRDTFVSGIEARLAEGWASFFLALDLLKEDVCQMAVALLVIPRQSRERPSSDIEMQLRVAAHRIAERAELASASRRLKFLGEAVAEASSSGWGWAVPTPMKCDHERQTIERAEGLVEGRNTNASEEFSDHINAKPRAFRMPWREKKRVFNIDGREFKITQFPKKKSEDEAEDGHVPQAERTGMVVWNSAVVMSFAVRDWIGNWSFRQTPRILELGAGLGLPGLVAAATVYEFYDDGKKDAAGARGEVILTDLPFVVDATRANVSSSVEALGLAAGAVRVEELVWGDHERLNTLLPGDHGADLVICADCVYFAKSHESLIRTFSELIRLNPSVVILMCQKRRNKREDEFFKKKLPGAGLRSEMMELPTGVTQDRAAKIVLGYEDELAFVGIDLVSICAATRERGT